MAEVAVGAAPAPLPRPAARRTLGVCCGAHVLHDGYADLIYVLLPVWQAEFSLTLVAVGFLRSLYSASMALLQMPSSFLAERIGERAVLALGTMLVGAAYLLAGWTGSVVALALCLVIGGSGASVQHPLGSTLTARAFEGRSLRAALSTYNFAGDIGKVLLPAAGAAMIAAWQWRWTTSLLGLAGIGGGLVIFAILHPPPATRATPPASAGEEAVPVPVPALPAALARRGFRALAAVGIVDSATRTGFLTLLPFLLAAKDADVAAIGAAVSLVFVGGATGKFVCGVVASRVGVLRTVILTECATAAGILLLLPLPLASSFLLLPFIGVALNGTSSVLYGTVAELAPAQRRARAFGFFYTATIGAGALSPTLYGRVSDLVGVATSLALVAAMVLLVLPLTILLRAPLAARAGA